MQSSQVIIGIDPGKRGFICRLFSTGEIDLIPITDIYRDMVHIVSNAFIVVEKVQPRPSQDLKAVVTSCVNYGVLKASMFWQGHDPFWVTPQDWQRELNLNRRWLRPEGMTDEQFSGWKYRKRKQLHKAAASKLFPGVRVTLHNADALLIAEYGRRIAKHF